MEKIIFNLKIIARAIKKFFIKNIHFEIKLLPSTWVVGRKQNEENHKTTIIITK